MQRSAERALHAVASDITSDLAAAFEAIAARQQAEFNPRAPPPCRRLEPPPLRRRSGAARV
jgi:hypothetical protein